MVRPAIALLIVPVMLFGAPAATTLDAQKINDAGTRERVGPRSKGEAVVRVQILLDRARISPGEIDGAYGGNLARAIRVAQTLNGLTPTGVVDDATWQLLNRDAGPVLVPYTISEEDVKGPFVKVPPKIMEQAKLKNLGYANAQEALGEKFHIHPSTLARLNPAADFSKPGSQIQVPNVLLPPPGTAARVEVNGKEGAVRVFDPENKLIAWYPASVGSKHDPLPVGEWKINGVQFNPVFHYNPDLFWDADAKDEKSKIAPGPNNPVGLVWIDLSKEHYGIHGTPQPAHIGKTESHGCIRLTNWSAVELGQMVKPGIPAILKME